MMAIRHLQPLSALALATVLAGCASTHGLKPETSLQDANRFQAANSLDRTPVSDVAWPKAQWWSAYGDPQLDALMQEALAGSPSIAVADARTRKAFAQAGLAEAGLYPTLGAGAQIASVKIPETLAPAHRKVTANAKRLAAKKTKLSGAGKAPVGQASRQRRHWPQ